MFDGLLGRKFYSKCKSSIKLMKVRLEAIRKKRNSVQKYLRNDIADLLRNGLDTNAYSRAEGLLIEMNMSSCYDFIEQFCGSISSHLSVMDKQRECPEECREAVASLIYAAARFADLPELRELRNIFTQRYGNSHEAFVNKEFVEKLRSKHPTKDLKLQLMQDIAQENSIEWDSKALEQKLYNPPPPRKDRMKNGSLNDNDDDGYNWNKSKDDAVPKRYNQDAGNKVREYTESRKNEEGLSSNGLKEVTDNEYKLHSSRENEVLVSHQRQTSSKDIHEDQDGQQNCSNSASVSQEEADDRKPFYYRFIPPPYVRQKAGSDSNEAPTDTQTRPDHKLNGHVNKEEENHHDDDAVGEAGKPKPRSVRRRKLKPPPGHDNAGSSETGMRQGDARQGLKSLCTNDHDQKDEEERMMDGLLMHYSKKPSPYDPEKVKENLKPPPGRQTTADTGRGAKNRSTDGNKYSESELVAPPARAKSFPLEPTSPTEAAKGHHRATSFQPEMMNPAGHVHPKLPDYDDLAARFAALRGRQKG